MTQTLSHLANVPSLPSGSLTVITGSMFAGKTEESIRRVRRALYACRSVQVFKHALETRSERPRYASTTARSTPHSPSLRWAGQCRELAGQPVQPDPPSPPLPADQLCDERPRPHP